MIIDEKHLRRGCSLGKDRYYCALDCVGTAIAGYNRAYRYHHHFRASFQPALRTREGYEALIVPGAQKTRTLESGETTVEQIGFAEKYASQLSW